VLPNFVSSNSLNVDMRAVYVRRQITDAWGVVATNVRYFGKSTGTLRGETIHERWRYNGYKSKSNYYNFTQIRQHRG